LRDRLDGRIGITGGIEASGWKLVYKDEPNGLTRSGRGVDGDYVYSLGLSLGKDGRVSTVLWDSLAFAAGIGTGMTVAAVNDVEYSDAVLRDAVKAAKTGTTPIRLLLKEFDRYRTVSIDYHGGLRYPHLERIEGRPDYLTPILSARKCRPATSHEQGPRKRALSFQQIASGRLHHPQRVVPFLQQFGLARLGLVQVRVLDVAVAADVLGDAGDVGGEVDVARVQPLQQHRHGLLVFADQGALAAAFGGVAEQVQRSAAQAAQFRQHAERGEHPAAVFPLLQLALGVLLRQQRRGEVELQLVVALELLREAAPELAAGVQARHFVLVLVGHQLEEV